MVKLSEYCCTQTSECCLPLTRLLFQAKNLINQMLTVNPAKRIRAEEALKEKDKSV